MKKGVGLVVLIVLLGLFSLPSGAEISSSPVPEVPVRGMVTLLDIGSDKCIPCKLMAPALKELEKEYMGKAAIVFMDYAKHPNFATKYEIRVLPTQIFFDKEGREVYRHEGFMRKKGIVSMLEKLGVEE